MTYRAHQCGHCEAVPGYADFSRHAGEGGLQSPVRNRLLSGRLARDPDHPFVAVRGPLVIQRDAELKAQAPPLWRAIQWATRRLEAAPVALLEASLDDTFDAASLEGLMGGDVT